MKGLTAAIILGCVFAWQTAGAADDHFSAGVKAYRLSEFSAAAKAFGKSATAQPAAGTFLNLGNAEWQRGRVGPAILAWERAQWLSPTAAEPHNNLKLARAIAQIEAPDLAWYEVASLWLPARGWAWVTAASLWLVAAMLALPGILRQRRKSWPQALATVGLTLFLISLPAHLGWFTRSSLGFVLQADTPLRLTPTTEAQEITRLGAGEPARCERVMGDYLYVRLNHAAGWVTREQFELVCPN